MIISFFDWQLWAGEGSLLFFYNMKKNIIYIDGFNFYCLVKNTAYKWLDIQKLSQSCLDLKKQTSKIKYFTALVKEQAEDSSNTSDKVYICEF